MRIGGIASGIDTEQIVRDLIRAESGRVNKLYQQEQRLKWRQEAYININRTIANFILNTRKEFELSRVSSTGFIFQGSVESFTWVKSAASSNESIVKATAQASAMTGSHTIQVDQLAETARVISGNLQGASGILDENLKFKEAGSFELMTHKGESILIEVTTDSTIHDLVRQINNAADGNGNHLGLRASYDSSLDQLMIITRDTGANSYIKINDMGGFAESKLNLGSDVVSENGVTGKNAEFWFNGTFIDTKSTNNFTIFGVNLQLLSVSTQEVTIQVDTNVEGIIEKIQSFVESYNALIDEINEKLNQEFYRNYPPLTKEQKEAMSEKDIELWEEKAKSGLLRGDHTLTRMLQSIRISLYEEVKGVTGSYDQLTQLGISTGDYRDGGKLVINENKLREAIVNDPEGIINVLFKTPEAGLSGSEKKENTGLIQRVYDEMIVGMKDIIRQSGTGNEASLFRNVQSNILMDFVTKNSSISSIDRDLMELNSRIIREETLLANKENRYWRQFSAMESALSRMNQQSMWLMSQMGIMGY